MTGGQDWAAECISTSGGKGMGEIQRWRINPLSGRLEWSLNGNLIKYPDHVAECDRLRAEVERWKERNNVLSNENDCMKNDWNVLQAEHMTLQEEFKLLNDRHNRLRCMHNKRGGDLRESMNECRRYREYADRLKDLIESIGCNVDADGNVVNFSEATGPHEFQPSKKEMWFDGKQPNYIPYTRETWPMDLTAVWLKGACYQLVELQECQAVFLASKCTEAISYMALVKWYYKPDGSPCGQEVEG